MHVFATRLRDARWSGGSQAAAIAGTYLLALGGLIAFAIVRLRWTYVVGIAFALLVIYVLVVWRRVEALVVGYIDSALIIEDAFLDLYHRWCKGTLRANVSSHVLARYEAKETTRELCCFLKWHC